MTPSHEDAFRSAIANSGLTPPDRIIADGELHRFSSNGTPQGDAGWYVFHPDGIPAGTFGDWRTGVQNSWRADIGRKLSLLEVEALREREQAARQKRELETERRHREASAVAAEIWKAASLANTEHPYLVAKDIRPCGARSFVGNKTVGGMDCCGALVIPLRDASGALCSLQFIDGDGNKRFLPSGQQRGCYFAIGTPGEVLCVVEGFATGASVHEATGHAVAVAFNAGNLEPVARAIRDKLPDIGLVICADDDYRTDGNPGITKATEAARIVGGHLAIPEFGANRPEKATDFNDVAVLLGLDAVRAPVANAKPVDAGTHQPDAGNASRSVLRVEDWPEPLALPAGLPPVASFDYELLPSTLRPWAEDICDRMQCPPDFVGATIMAALGSVVGCKLAVRPQKNTDWNVVPNQWALIVGRPGVLKSPAMEAALGPLKRLAAKASEAYRVASEDFETTARLAKLKAEVNDKAARTELAKNTRADVRELLEDQTPDAPILRRYIANDTNAASLGELLRHNPNGTLVHRDELVSLLMTLDREDNAEARGFYLTGWNGDSSYTIDRIGRGMNLYIPALCVSLLGSTQPGRIAGYVHTAIKGGAGDDGLIQRFGLTVFPDPSGDWRDVDRLPNSSARVEADSIFEYLDTLDLSSIGAQQDERDGMPQGTPYLRLDRDAHGLFLEWRKGYEGRLRANELHLALESHLAKYRKLVPGLALIIHLAERNSGSVGKRSMIKALAWAQYLETHAARLYASGTNQEVPAARAIVDKLRKGQLSPTFSSRDVWRPGWAGLSDREQVTAALRLLGDLDWLGVSKVETQGRTATAYTANPRCL